MSIFYSKTTKGFHHASDGMDNVPSDGAEITFERYKQLLDGQAVGKVIVADDQGCPILVDPTPPAPTTYDVKRALEYPSIGDQLDALFHAGVFPEEMAEQIQAIKDKYPKA